MIVCVKDVADDCVRGILSESQVDTILRNNFQDSDYCLEGSLKVPDSSSGASLPCTSTYLQRAHLCGKTFHQKFDADWSDPSLCR